MSTATDESMFCCLSTLIYKDDANVGSQQVSPIITESINRNYFKATSLNTVTCYSENAIKPFAHIVFVFFILSLKHQSFLISSTDVFPPTVLLPTDSIILTRTLLSFYLLSDSILIVHCFSFMFSLIA